MTDHPHAASARTTGLVAGGATAVGLTALAGLSAGAPAAVAVVVGAVAAGASAAAMVRGVAALLEAGERPAAGRVARATTYAAFVLRHAVVGAVFLVAVVGLALPGPWLLAGAAVAPLALLAWAVRRGASERSAVVPARATAPAPSSLRR